jgi:hypothetical protein
MSRLVIHAFERYQRERLVFSQAALDFVRQQDNVEALVAAGGVTLLQNLSKDPAPGYGGSWPTWLHCLFSPLFDAPPLNPRDVYVQHPTPGNVSTRKNGSPKQGGSRGTGN